MSKNPLKKKIAICNLIISVLCVLSIVAYFIMPFWRVELSLTLNTETFESVMGDMMPENSNSDENSDDENSDEEGISFTDGNQIVMLSSDSDENLSSEEKMMEDIIKDVVGNGITVPIINLELKTVDLLDSLSGDSTEAVETMLGNIVDNLVDEIYGPVTEIISKTTKAVAKQAAKTTVRESIKTAFGDEKSEEEVNQILTDAGISDKYIDDSLNDIMTKLEGGVEVEEISDDVVAMVQDAMGKLEAISNDYPEFEDMKLSEEDEEELRAELEEMLTEIANEAGEINLDEVLADMLLQMIELEGNGEGEGEYDEGSAAIAPVKVTYTASSSAEESGDSQGNSVEQLKGKIRDLIMEELGADKETVDAIAMIMQVISYVILFTFFTWFYLILKILVKLGAKNNAIKLKVPILFGWLPCLVLVLIPSIAFSVLTDTTLLAKLDISLPEEATTILGMIDLKSISASIVSFVVAIVLFLFVIFYYGRLRRKLRKQIKAAKKAAKLGYATGDDSSSSSDSSSDDNNDYDY